jgi:hypothetical protein
LNSVLAMGLVVVLLWATYAFAFVPLPNRTLKAIAQVNRASGRTTAIQLELTMRVGNQEPIASGELISHPSGLARLELRGYGGRTDRYLLSGNELLATKGGRRLDQPQPMLQPFFLLQPATEETLRAALETFGVQSEWIGLATCGDQDCFVFGDPRLAAPLPSTLDGASATAAVLDDPLDALDSDGPSGESERPDDDRLAGPALTLPEDGRIPRIWVDTQDLQMRRIDRRNGVFTVFGPPVQFEKLTVPAWFEIHEPGAPSVRFDVDRAVQVNAPPQAFSQEWLMSPVGPPSPSEVDSSDPAALPAYSPRLSED